MEIYIYKKYATLTIGEILLRAFAFWCCECSVKQLKKEKKRKKEKEKEKGKAISNLPPLPVPLGLSSLPDMPAVERTARGVWPEHSAAVGPVVTRPLPMSLSAGNDIMRERVKNRQLSWICEHRSNFMQFGGTAQPTTNAGRAAFIKARALAYHTIPYQTIPYMAGLNLNVQHHHQEACSRLLSILITGLGGLACLETPQL